MWNGKAVAWSLTVALLSTAKSVSTHVFATRAQLDAQFTANLRGALTTLPVPSSVDVHAVETALDAGKTDEVLDLLDSGVKLGLLIQINAHHLDYTPALDQLT